MLKGKQGQTKRLIPMVMLIFTLTLFLMMLPVNLPKAQASVCSYLQIIVAEPVEGEKLATNAVVVNTSGGQAYVDDIKWSSDSEEGVRAGEQYTVTVTCKPTEGAEFDETTEVLINHESGEVALNEDGSLSVSYTFSNVRERELVSSVEVSITKPQYEGTDLSDTEWMGGDNGGTWSANIRWSPEPINGLAVAGEKYTATVTINPLTAAGFTWDTYTKFDENTTVTINDVPVDAVLNEDGTLTASFAFPKTKAYGLISSTEIYVEEPTEGSELSANITYDTVRWESAKLIWYPELDEDEIVAAGESYTANVILYPKDGCTFNESTAATINGKDAKVRVNSDGSLTAYYTFTLPSSKKSIEEVSVSGIKNREYTGKEEKPVEDEIIVKDGESCLMQGVDYEITYPSDNYTEAGKKEIKISGIGNYSGEKTVSYEITKKSIEEANVSEIKDREYTGKEEKAAEDEIIVKDGESCLMQGVDYEITYPSDNYTEAGKKEIKISGMGNYSGEKTVSYEIKASAYTGLKQIDGIWYYVKNDQIDRSYTGFAKNNAGIWYVKKGKVDFKTTEVVKVGINWYNVVNGRLITGPTLGKNSSGWWYIDKNGKVDFSVTTLVRYYNVWYYVENGKLNWNYTGLCKYEGVWYYVQSGKLNWNYTGLCKYGNAWYYVQSGKLNWNYTGLCKYGSSWYYVQSGKLNWNYTGLTQYYGTWYYVEKGVLNWNYTGLVNHYGGWYYVEKGKINWNYIGLVRYYGGWYYVEKGKINWNYTGFVKNSAGVWYVQKGSVNFSYSGTINGRAVVKGKVQ